METSWDFLRNELIRIQIIAHTELEEAVELYQQYWKNKFFQLHQIEEELNRQFIEIYGLKEELTPYIPLEDISILQYELNRKSLSTLNKKLLRDHNTLMIKN
jgi:hypothetical protein